MPACAMLKSDRNKNNTFNLLNDLLPKLIKVEIIHFVVDKNYDEVSIFLSDRAEALR